jgi:hypothetical protein
MKKKDKGKEDQTTFLRSKTPCSPRVSHMWGTFRAHVGNIHSPAPLLGGPLNGISGNIRGTCGEHSGHMWGTFRAHVGNIHSPAPLLGGPLNGIRPSPACPPRCRPYRASGTLFGPFLSLPGPVPGTFREHSGNIRGTFKEHSVSQGTFREHSGNIQYSVNIQGTFGEHSGNIQRELSGRP